MGIGGRRKLSWIRDLSSLELKFLVHFSLSRIWIHLPIWVIFFLSKGYTLYELALLNSVMWLSVIIFEIPTGYIADYFGRKFSLILSYVIQSFGILVWVIAETVTFLTVAHIIWGDRDYYEFWG